MNISPDELRHQLLQLDAAGTDYATRFVDLLLAAAQSRHASDVHLTPAHDGLLVVPIEAFPSLIVASLGGSATLVLIGMIVRLTSRE